MKPQSDEARRLGQYLARAFNLYVPAIPKHTLEGIGFLAFEAVDDLRRRR